jgi:hypothetical protein
MSFPLIPMTVVAQTTQIVQQNSVHCLSRDPSKNLACLRAQVSRPSSAGVRISEYFVHDQTKRGLLNYLHEIANKSRALAKEPNAQANSIPLPTNEIYRSAHWIWFANATIYSQYRAYIDPLLNWPETSYGQIGGWLGLNLPPGSFDGGRRAIYVDSNPGYFGWTSNGNIGIGFQVFKDFPDWPWVVIPQETTNMFTGEGVTGGWPTDWWADGRSPFPAMVAVQVEKAYNDSYFAGHDAADSQDPQYVMFRDQLLGKFGWPLFQTAFTLMIMNGVNLANIHSEFESSNWYNLHYLKSQTVAYYLSRAVGIDLSAILNQGKVGTAPPNWTGSFANYQINLSSVLPTAYLKSPTSVQHGMITLTSNASDPDWGVHDQTFWWSPDNVVFYMIGTTLGNATSMTWNTTQVAPNQKNQFWVMTVSHDYSEFESSWSVSTPFTIDNTFDFSLSNSGGITLTQGNSGSNAIAATLTSGSSQSVSLSCLVSLPLGVSCNFNPASSLPTFASTLTVSTSLSTPSGVYAVNVTGKGGDISRQTQFELTVKPGTTYIVTGVDSGSGSVTPNCPSPNGCTETIGQLLTVTATPSPGWSFSSWSTQSGISCSNASCSFNMPNYPVTLKATFTPTSPSTSLGQVISNVYNSSSTLGFELTGNVADNSGAGFMIGHRSGNKVSFTFSDTSRVNGTTHRLLFTDYSNALLVGGPKANPTMAFYQTDGFAHLIGFVNSNGTFSIIHRPDNVRALYVPLSSITDSNDYFVMQSFADGAHTVIAMWGIQADGTLANGVYIDLQFGNLSALNQGSYVIHWQDTNGNGIPDSGDTFTTAYSGT